MSPSGYDETAGEDTDDLICELAADIGMTLKPEDISVSQSQPQTAGTIRQHREVCTLEYKDGDDKEQEEAK